MSRSVLLAGAVAAVVWVQACPLWGAVIHVKPDGTGDARTVQGGIALSADGDTIWVHPGRYVENVRFGGKEISLISVAGPEATILDGSGEEESVVRIIDGEGPATLLQGFTITGGRAPRGAGIAILGSEPRVKGNRITENTAISGGGGLCAGVSFSEPARFPRIEENTFLANTAETLGGAIEVAGNSVPRIERNSFLENIVTRGDGGGITVFSRLDGIVIRDNWIEGNIAGDHGGGAYLVGRAGSPELPLDLEFSGNVVVRNRARARALTGDSGGGIWSSGTSVRLCRNTIVGNAGEGGDGWGGGVVLTGSGAPMLERNIIAHSSAGGGLVCTEQVVPNVKNNVAWNNMGGEGWGACEDWWRSNGNMIADPLLCDWEAGVYTVAENSPALTHPAGPVGAFPNPGCVRVAVTPVTWSALKQRYGN